LSAVTKTPTVIISSTISPDRHSPGLTTREEVRRREDHDCRDSRASAERCKEPLGRHESTGLRDLSWREGRSLAHAVMWVPNRSLARAGTYAGTLPIQAHQGSKFE